jgi:hypothetical protein
MECSYLLGLVLAAFEAILRRLSLLAGSCAQQNPCGLLAASVQGSPFALVARHTPISGYPPPVAQSSISWQTTSRSQEINVFAPFRFGIGAAGYRSRRVPFASRPLP